MDTPTPETPSAAAAPAASPEIVGKSKKRFRILLLVSAVCAAVLKWSFIFFFIGTLPAMVAYAIDHDKHKYIFSTIAALNIAGVFPDMMDIFMHGGTLDAVEAKLGDPFVWLFMYSVAGLGWVIVWLSPLLATTLLEGIYQGRIMHMESVQKKLEDEWGPEVNPAEPKAV